MPSLQAEAVKIARRPRLLLALSIFALLLLSGFVSAAVHCNTTEACERKLRPGSTCVDNKCTNPFASGCLNRLLGDEVFPRRACNSDDPPSASSDGLCVNSPFNYTEIRVANGNWESSMFLAWIIQIILSEILGVPSTIETSSSDSCSFYDMENSFAYAKDTYNWEGIKEANATVDCRKTNKKCAHIMPEVWSGQRKEWLVAEKEGFVEPVGSMYVIGKLGWFVPKFTAQRENSVVTLLGLAGDDKREKLAGMFKRPTTWGEYCREVSPTNCTGAREKYLVHNGSQAEAAMRGPVGVAEDAMYFHPQHYTGHFRPTTKNDCNMTANCTGHFVEPICEWSTFCQAQLHWNQIPMESDGPITPYGAYSWASMIEIWKAANATKSDIMMYWWRPDSLVQMFHGTDAEFVPVMLGEPTEECANARITNDERCSADPAVRWGDPKGACDYEANILRSIIAKSLKDSTYAVPEASRSAAYDTIKNLRLSDLVIDRLLRNWSERGVDKYGYDPRHTVCEWVAENIEGLRRSVPDGYPRQIKEGSTYNRVYLHAAKALGGLTALLVVLTALTTWQWRKKWVMVYAQPSFLILILGGFILVSAGAIVFAIEPSLGSCVARQWLVILGYSLELLPLIVKVAAINKLDASARKMKRVTLRRKYLFGIVGIFLLLVVVYLSIWTAVDPPTSTEDRILATDRTADNGLYVEITIECSSNSNWWFVAALGWQALLLLSTTILGFQARNVRVEFNESQQLAFMIYSHFMFVLLRFVIYLLWGTLQPDVASAFTSVLLSLDTLVTLVIYFGPKLVEVRKNPSNRRPARRPTRNSIVNTSGSRSGSLCSHQRSGSNVLSSGEITPRSSGWFGSDVNVLQHKERRVSFSDQQGLVSNDSSTPLKDSESLISVGIDPLAVKEVQQKEESFQDEVANDEGGNCEVT